MSDRPYTEDDLRAEAARQHAFLTEDPDFVGVGEGMEDGPVHSTSTDTDPARTWEELLDPERDGTDAFNAAQRKIHDLINGAANTSEWAVNLGADGLQPDEHAITINGGNKPIARIHFAFEPGMPDEMRTDLVEGIGQAINAHL
ncbi:hypothetical protein V2J94_41605 [Streptomyces sp. DSM 41524]|uniref:Lipoprotein n=1 Tax=Streptomyces asiaticus subsp. ignotus TaxID=3098222 RepID=A0ABU7QBC6_9ACTN|nr:hypothetical protein [Streptomyces sp. DSM 41524]